MKSNEPCNLGYQNVGINLPVHNDPKLVGVIIILLLAMKIEI